LTATTIIPTSSRRSLFRLLVTNPALPLRSLIFSPVSIDFINESMFRKHFERDFELPQTLTSVKMDVRMDGQRAMQQLFRALDRLPNLESLESYFSEPKTGDVFAPFPNLRRCAMRWTGQAYLLDDDNGVKIPILHVPEYFHGTSNWESVLLQALRRMKHLQTVILLGCPTSFMAGFSLLPGITKVFIDRPVWNLGEDEKRAVAELKNVKIKFHDIWYSNHPEVGFWRSLPFVEF